MENILQLLYSPSIAAILCTVTLVILTLHNYSRTGPGVQKEIEKKFGYYVIFAISRLTLWLFTLFFITSLPGPIAIFSLSSINKSIDFDFYTCLFGSLLSTLAITSYFFLHQLLYSPGTIQISFQYRFSRLLNLWKILSPKLICNLKLSLIFSGLLIVIIAGFFSVIEHKIEILSYSTLTCFLYFYLYLATLDEEPNATQITAQTRPNIVMIGSDTLRKDRLGIYGYHRQLTPNIDRLCQEGTVLSKCITPLARTAPSIASLFTGLWPHNHKVRDNYPSSADCQLPKPTLIDVFNQHGYRTIAISDWCGADFSKLSFNFKQSSTAEDQWNIKLLIRQGPSLIRNVISLFTNNALGKRFLPEFYYLAGVPLTRQLGLECRQLIADAVKNNEPFFINLFTSTTHVPFNSEYPYYNLFTPKDYQGESRFIMTRLATAEEIVDKQERDAKSFDVQQIINLYDSCVKQFDDEVGKIIEYLDRSGLSENTVIVIYSDHGADFFETGCWGQGNTLVGNDPSGNIPMVLKGPGVPKGINIDYTTRAIDLMPTLLGVLDMPIPPNLDGVNLLPYIRNGQSPQLYAFQETGIWLGKIPGLHPQQILYPSIVELLDIPDKKTGTLEVNQKYYPTVIRAKSRSIQDERWKLIYIATYGEPVYQLYDLKQDPYRDVLDQYPEVYTRLKVLLDEHMKQDPFLNDDLSKTN